MARTLGVNDTQVDFAIRAQAHFGYDFPPGDCTVPPCDASKREGSVAFQQLPLDLIVPTGRCCMDRMIGAAGGVA